MIISSNNQRLQRMIVQRWQLFRVFNETEQPILTYNQTPKSYGMTNTYRV